MYRGISLLLAANVETVGLILAAWWLGGWLNENYPKSFSWFVVTFLVALVVIVHSWYVIFKMIMKPNEFLAPKNSDQKINKKAQ